MSETTDTILSYVENIDGNVQALQESVDNLENRIQNIEDKLDRILKFIKAITKNNDSSQSPKKEGFQAGFGFSSQA